MNTGSLRDRVQSCLSDLDAAKESIRSPQLGAVLAHVRADFEQRIVRLQERLSDIDEESPASEQWREFEIERKIAGGLIRECLALVEGTLLRSNDIDAGLCEVADAFLAQLNAATRLGWNSFTLVADGESFGDIAEIIRLRFPVTGVWDLAIAAHEFGHFASARLQPASPVAAYYKSNQEFAERRLAAARESENLKEKQLDEFFADTFATFVLGPAYLRTCLYSRFQPTMADEESDEVHPSFARRAYVILKVIERMEAKVPEYRTARESAKEYWTNSCAACGTESIEQDKGLDAMVRETLKFLRDCAAEAEYREWTRAQSLSARMRSNKPPGPILRADNTIADVLNAAWILRLQEQPDLSADQISSAALDLCRTTPQPSGAPVCQR